MEFTNNISEWPIYKEENREYLTFPDSTTSELINLDSGNYVQINYDNQVTEQKWSQDQVTWHYNDHQYQPQIQEKHEFYEPLNQQQNFYYNQNGDQEIQQMNVHNQNVPISNIKYEDNNNVASTSGTQQYNNYNINYMANNNAKQEAIQQQFLYQQNQQQQQPLQQQEEIIYQVIVPPVPVAPLRAQTVSPAESGISTQTPSSSSDPSTTSEGENARVICPQCHRSFAKDCYLKQHQKTAHDIMPFRCKKCGKKHKTQELLEKHIDRHNIINKPYKCTFVSPKFVKCKLAYLYSSDLRRHAMSHMKKKPYICELCSKDFTRKDHLMNHKRTHRNRKN